MATNGLRYGAQVEIRENFIAAQANTRRHRRIGSDQRPDAVCPARLRLCGGRQLGPHPGRPGRRRARHLRQRHHHRPAGWRRSVERRRADHDPPATGPPIRGSRSRAPSTATTRSSICRRRSPASTSASSGRRTTATRNSAVLAAAGAAQPVVLDHAAAGCALREPVRRRRALPGHVRPGRGVWLRHVYRQRPRQLHGHRGRGDHRRRRPLACAGQPVHRPVQGSECRLRWRGLDMGRVHRSLVRGRAVSTTA